MEKRTDPWPVGAERMAWERDCAYENKERKRQIAPGARKGPLGGRV